MGALGHFARMGANSAGVASERLERVGDGLKHRDGWRTRDRADHYRREATQEGLMPGWEQKLTCRHFLHSGDSHYR